MHIEINDQNSGAFQSVKVVHGDSVLTWSTITYGKLKFHDIGRMFTEFNEYMARKPAEVQLEVFEAYHRIHGLLTKREKPPADELEGDEEQEEHTRAIRADIARIYKHYTAADVDDLFDGVDSRYGRLLGICVGGEVEARLKPEDLWAKRYTDTKTGRPVRQISDIKGEVLDTTTDQIVISKEEIEHGLQNADQSLAMRYPKTMLNEFPTSGDNNGRTYRRSDYRDLVKFALRLRPMIPIFGQYTKSIGKDSPNGTHYKESTAITLLYNTDVLECPAMDKLHEYMEFTLQKFAHQKTAGVHRGLGSTELPYWLARKATFRRVAIGELDSGDDLSSIVTNVYNFTKTTLDSMPRNFGSTRNKTRVNDGAASAEENISLLESFKVRQALPDGDKVLINVYCRDPLAYAKIVDPTIPDALVVRCTTVTGEWASQEIHPFQITLVRWVLSRALSPRDVDLLGRESALMCIGATQAILYHWGYKSLASLMAAVPHVDYNVAPTTSLWAREQLSKEMVKTLSDLYPYYRMSGKKDQSVDELNPGIVGIGIVTQDIYQNDWKHSQPEWMSAEVAISDMGTLLIPPNLKQQLAEVLIRSVTDV